MNRIFKIQLKHLNTVGFVVLFGKEVRQSIKLPHKSSELKFSLTEKKVIQKRCDPRKNKWKMLNYFLDVKEKFTKLNSRNKNKKLQN